MVNINQCRKGRSRKHKRSHISIRISDSVMQWLREENLSPTSIFYAAIDEMGYRKWKDKRRR